MRMVDIIERKALGQELTKEEIAYFVDGYVHGDIPDYQAAAFLMAIRQRDMSAREAADLTDAMMHSGDTVDLSDLPGIKVDKHSSGGVGDTTTLVVGPLVAACGGTVAKMSGRGLAFSGGTLDKLEAIPHVQVEQPIERFKQIVLKNGVAVIGQSANLVPADKKMYALRDVTATVQSVPLIASSIMSKKLAAGADSIVLDVKVGTGAFMKTVDDAKRLARLMTGIGKHLNRSVVAVITDMNQPLGMAIGNALEMREAVQLLLGKIPPSDPLYRVCMLLAGEMLMLSNLADSQEQAEAMLTEAIVSGRGMEKLIGMVQGLGGDVSYLTLDGMDWLCKVRRHIPLYAKTEGYVGSFDTEQIGYAAQLLGAGRAVKTDIIDPAVGLVMHCRVGDRITKKDPICTLYVNDEKRLEDATDCMMRAVRIVAERPTAIPPMVYDIVRA